MSGRRLRPGPGSGPPARADRSRRCRAAGRAAPIRLLFSPYPCPMDILVYTPAEIDKWYGTANHIVTEAMDTGKTAYGRT